MKKLMLVSVMLSMFLLAGCATVEYKPSENDLLIRAWNDKFWDIYRNGDLKQYIGKTKDDLVTAFSTPDTRWTGEEGEGRLDVYGNGTVEYSPIYTTPIYSDPIDNRIVFYMRKYKVYNAVKY